ncbi:MAG: hypothetical protein IKJ93_01875 [Clostridia bacterium]|nr:hypothetical protein [Clostridia bacterium]
MNNNFDKIDKQTLDAARRGDTNAVLKNLNESDRKKIEEVLADQDKLKQILNSDTAKNLMKFLGGKHNG